VDNITKIIEGIKIVHEIKEGDIIIDIRHPNEYENKPLEVGKNIEIINIPFYVLHSYSKELLNLNEHHILYCRNSAMSKLQAAHMIHKGFEKVKILDRKINYDN
jgi:thiamine biosynthesis protein ThiI